MLKRHEERAADFRVFAIAARDKSRLSALPRVRELHERAAVRWEALAELEDLFVGRRRPGQACPPAHVPELAAAGS